jgi:hypothetical protein
MMRGLVVQVAARAGRLAAALMILALAEVL